MLVKKTNKRGFFFSFSFSPEALKCMCIIHRSFIPSNMQVFLDHDSLRKQRNIYDLQICACPLLLFHCIENKRVELLWNALCWQKLSPVLVEEVLVQPLSEAQQSRNNHVSAILKIKPAVKVKIIKLNC